MSRVPITHSNRVVRYAFFDIWAPATRWPGFSSRLMCGGRNERKPNVSTVKARPAGAGRGLPVVSAGRGHMKQDESVRRAACILHCYVIITEAIFVIKRVMFE
jgi:hypothetical protein